MAYTDLRDWIKQLDKAGELKRIREAVSPYLEMAEIADRAAKLGKGTAKAGGAPAALAGRRCCLRTSRDFLGQRC